MPNLSLFSDSDGTDGSPELPARAPLAAQLRPMTLAEFLGQGHLVGEGSILERMIKAKRLSSLVLFGPPGTGKTSLARIIAAETECRFVELNATDSGTKEVRGLIGEAKLHLRRHQQKTLVFIDEIHRFNKAQQDVLLPDVENGFIVLVGATTGNPHFTINSALLSRSQLFEFKPLDEAALLDLIVKAVDISSENTPIRVSDEGAAALMAKADGDGRRLLNAFEMSLMATHEVDGHLLMDAEVVGRAVQMKTARYDKDGDNHYDVISAFIKSIRGSDPDAAIYWLARMLDAGEDIRFIARRIVISAAEDVGNAQPQALILANSAAQAVELVGMPEARIILSQAVTFLATCPKSNKAYMAINQALSDVKREPIQEVPEHLKGTSYTGAKSLGRGKGYQYPHDFPDHFVSQRYMSSDKVYYQPSSMGYEAKIKERLEEWRKQKPS